MSLSIPSVTNNFYITTAFRNPFSLYGASHEHEKQTGLRAGNRTLTLTNLTPGISAMFNDEYYKRRWFMLDHYQDFSTETVDLIREYLGDEPKSMRKPGAKVPEPSDMSLLPTPVRVHFLASSIFSFQHEPRKDLTAFEYDQEMRCAFRLDKTCLICQEDMDRLSAKATLIFCKTCKNFSHNQCFKTWLTTVNAYNVSMWRGCPLRCHEGKPVTTHTSTLVLRKDNSLKTAQGPFPAIQRNV